MATTPPDQVRAGLAIVTAGAAADVRAVAASADGAEELRSVLFAATPLIVADYFDGSSALALDWYEELRDEAAPDLLYVPVPAQPVADDEVRAIVAATTLALVDPPSQPEALPDPIETSLKLVSDSVVELVASGFRSTVTENAVADPGSVGWRRFARPEACKFCLMLAARGAVYTEKTARFAAHGAVMRGKRKGGNCMCIAGPAFGGKEIWAEATPMQYLASRPVRDAHDRARLREYLNDNFPDAPG